jgi:hypothetical protein
MSEGRDLLLVPGRDRHCDRNHDCVHDQQDTQLARVLHDRPLPFSLGNWRADFIDGFRAAVRESA